MVTGSRMDGGTQILSARVRKTIQSIKEIVGNHSDADIYVVLKETNMDPNETAQKLLNQDPFHEVKRKRDRKKETVSNGSLNPRKFRENDGYNGLLPPRTYTESVGHNGFVNPRKFRENAGQNGSVYPRRHSENAGQGMKFRTFSDRNVQRGGYTRSGISREFRVVRDNRVSQDNKEMKPPAPQCSTSNDQVDSSIPEKSSAGTSTSQKASAVQSLSQARKEASDSHARHFQDNKAGGSDRKADLDEKHTSVLNAASRVQAAKPSDSQAHSEVLSSSNSEVGVYSSSTDPVHVPSPDSRSSAAVGAIKREVGVVGVRRQSSGNATKESSASSSSFSNSLLGRDISSESFRPFSAISKADQVNQTSMTESVIPNIPVNRTLLNSQYAGRAQQQVVGHQKAPQHNKEWKPKSSQKSSVNSPGVIGTPTKSVSPTADDSRDLESEAAKLQEKILQVNIYENQNVIIAEHIRVPDTDRFQLTFGSFGVEFDSSSNIGPGFQAVGGSGKPNVESSSSLSASAPASSGDDASGSKQTDILDDQVRNSSSSSLASAEVTVHQLPDRKETSSPQDLDSFAEIGLVHDNSPSYAPSESQQRQDPPELSSFSAYDPQTGYDLPYFRPVDESLRGQALPSPQEQALSLHTGNSIPTSTIAMIQQQQQQQAPMTQMYPQVHVSHFANLMPYRQILSPVYVPPMAIPGYSSNPAYPHPSNASSYVLMPGGSSHLGANGLKYGIQQFKPVPAGGPTGFGNFTNPNGYALNAPGVVGSATGLEDSSRIKYKDGNLYVPNPQAESSEVWIQNPRELPGMQSAPYYNMPGQTPHAAYLPSHTGHASFNAAAAQSSHMQFQGIYHPPPPQAAMANPHHLGPALGGNVGVGVAPAAPGHQVSAYQQPQLGHLNWTTNF